jgi:hypothetical protein
MSTYSQRSSVLALLFKKGDPLLLDNFRPISLLNVDLKILSYVLAQRLKKILSKIINEDQTGYTKDRCTTDTGYNRLCRHVLHL